MDTLDVVIQWLSIIAKILIFDLNTIFLLGKHERGQREGHDIHRSAA